MSKITHGAVALALLAGALLVTAQAMAEPRDARGIRPITFFSPKADYKTDHRRRYANYRRYDFARGDFERNAAPTSTPVRLNPNRKFYIGPHYKSQYGPGYHTNGPGIGIIR